MGFANLTAQCAIRPATRCWIRHGREFQPIPPAAFMHRFAPAAARLQVPRPSRRLSRRYSHRSDWRFCFSMPASSSTRSACTRLMSALVRVASAWMSFDLAAAATFCSFARKLWLVHRAWLLRQNSYAAQPLRRPASSRQRYALRSTLQPHASAPRLRSRLRRLHAPQLRVLLAGPRSPCRFVFISALDCCLA